MTIPAGSLLVTGGAGFIGSIVSERLLSRGYDVVSIDNLATGHRGAVPAGVVFYEGDYGDAGILREIFSRHDIGAVLHFGGATTVEKSQTDPRYYFETNLVRGIALLDTMLETGCTRIIFSSTAAIFGEPVQVPIDETHPQAPINAYGASKLMFETVLDWYHRAYGLRFNAFRYFNAAGASDRFGECHQPESHLIPILCEVAQGRRENITLFGNDYPTDDGTCVRDYVHVLDLADAHILALGNLEERPSARYNLGNGRGFSNLEVLRTVERVSGHPVSFEYGDRRAGDPAVLVASSARAREELGWSPRYGSVEDIVRTAWDWHEAHPRGYDGAGGI